MAFFVGWRRSIAKWRKNGAIPLSREEFAKQRRYAMVADLAVVASVFLILSLEISIWIKRLAALVLILSSPGDWIFDSYESYLKSFRKPQSSSE